MTGRRAPGRAGYAWLALGSALFTLYGSLVPFHFRARPLGEAVEAFGWVLANRVAVESRADGLANVLLGVPLGYCALAALRTDRPGRATSALVAVALLPACAAFAAAVEFTQLYFPGRTCSASDILAQTAGSALGLVAWLAVGPAVTRWLRWAWNHPLVGGVAGHRVAYYAVVVTLAQMLPLDIDTSPRDLYRRVTGTHLDELLSEDHVEWLGLAVLFAPAGLLLGAVPSRGGVAGAFAFGLLLAGATECGQLVVSRHPSVADALVGAAAVAAGRGLVGCRVFRRRCARDSRPTYATTEATI